MKRYAFIENGTVTQIIEGNEGDNWAEYYGRKRGVLCVVIPDNERVGIGFLYTDSVFENLVTELSEAEQLEQWRQSASLSRRRFKIGEALYLVDGTPLVQLIEALLAGLPEPTKTVATISYEQSGNFDRLDPFILQFSGALGMSEEETDAFFHYCINEEWNQ